MKRLGRLAFGCRDDLDLNQRWWHRLAKVAFILSLVGIFLWFLTIPAELPSGPRNIRIVETLANFTRAHPDAADAGESFTKKYGYRFGKREPDGSVSYAFFETKMYCAARPYEHLDALARYLRPATVGHHPTGADALAILRRVGVKEDEPAGYTCILPNGDTDTPGPEEIVGWEHTLRAKVIGNAQKFGIMLVADASLALVVLNLYYRGFVYVVCGPRR